MTSVGPPWKTSVVLMLLCFVSGAFYYNVATSPLVSPPAPTAAAKSSEQPLPGLREYPLQPVPLPEQLAVITERYLFSPDRKVPEPAAETGPAAEPTQYFPYTLAGVVIAPTGRTAMLVKMRTRETLRVSEGQRVDGWTISQISPEGILVSNDDGEQELRLEDVRSPTDPQLHPRSNPATQKLAPLERAGALIRKDGAAIRENGTITGHRD